jgi:hypothetical protein
VKGFKMFFPGMIPPNIGHLPEIGKVKFELKFNKSTGIEKSFTVNIFYDKIRETPCAMRFIKFEDINNLRKAQLCHHNCVQNRQVRFFIKYVPEGIKPFSLKLVVCPECHAPMTYQFIVYPGDLKSYPKMKDFKRLKAENKQFPKSVQSSEFKIGVA